MEIVLCERAKCLEMEMSGKCTEKFLRTVDARGTPERERLDGCIVWNAHNTVFVWKSSAVSHRWFLAPTLFLKANGISIALAVFVGLTR